MSELPEPKKYATQLEMHLKFANGGYSFCYQLKEYAGIFVHHVKESRNHKTVQVVVYDGDEYEKISHAVTVWEFKNKKDGSDANKT